MSNPPQFSSPDRISLLIDFPIRLYTALRTMRLYPASNPQVQRSNDFVLTAFKALLESRAEESVNIAFSDHKILICGEHLPDKDQDRPQIQGLVALFNRLKIHSFTFQPTFSRNDCIKFIQILSQYLSEKVLTEPISTLLDKAEIHSISVDAKRYVAIHEGEQVIREELLVSRLSISDEELANYVQGTPSRKGELHSISPELVKELINRMPVTTDHHLQPDELTEAVIETLQNLSKEIDLSTRDHNIEESASTLSGLDPDLLAKLAAHLPATPIADEMLSATLHHLTQQQLNALITHFVTQQTTRVRQPSGADRLLIESGQVDQTILNRMLGHYEQFLNNEQQAQVAQEAGAQIASMEGSVIGNILAQNFKGLFGTQLYRQIISQVSDERLDETVEHLTPRQLGRMITTLTGDNAALRLNNDKASTFNPANDSVLKRLVHTQKGSAITAAIAQNIDAHFLQAPPESGSVLPEGLAARLQQPSWSTPILVNAAQHSIDPANYKNGKADFSTFERMLDQYDTLLSKENQSQVATQASLQLASFDEKELGLILVQKFKNLFGDQLYQQVIKQISDEKFEKLARQFQAITERQDDLPLDQQDKDIEEAYKRLLQTVRGEKIRAIIEMDTRKEKDRHGLTTIDLDILLQGNLKGLEQKNISQALPGTIRNLLSQGDEVIADKLLRQLAATPQHQDSIIQTNAARTLASVAEHLDNIGQWQRLDKLLPALQQGLRIQGADEQSIKQTITAIGGLTSHYLVEKEYNQALVTTRFLRTLSSEAPLTPGSNPLIREQALETLKNLCTQPVLEHLLDLYLHSESQQETAGQMLIELRKQSTKFQLQQLISNKSRFERKRLLALIKQTGHPAIDILLEELHPDAPWFVIRNIIHLLGEINNPSILREIQPYIKHADLRVQQETINTAIKIGGENISEFLFDALQTVDDSIKIKVVNHVATIKGDHFVSSLTDILESTKPFLGKYKNNLHLSICKALGVIGSKRANTSLNRVSQSRNPFNLGGYSDEVRQAARLALEQIRMAQTSQKKGTIHEELGIKGPDKLSLVTSAGTQSTPIDVEAEIFTIAAQGNRDQAIKRLLDLITTTARAGDFPTAERLRERIYEIDSLALGEIIRSGEIIEQEKKGAINEDDLTTWAALTDRLSSEEFTTMYHEFTEHRYKPEETLVNQGDKNETLFFIAQGSVKVSHTVGPREIFITSLNRGQIAGENFFAPSFWTVSLTSLTPSKVYILQQTSLNGWQEKFPRLRAKLHEFYTASNTVQSILKKKGLDRRKDQRFNLSRKIQVQPITNLDSPIGRGFRAEIIDIAVGGLAFLIRISKQESVRLLLGRRLQVVLPIGGANNFLHLNGLVVSIQPFKILENDFSIHFKFDRPLEQQVLQSILG